MSIPINQPKVTIITVCLNSGATIAKTIESVVNQTYSNIEYLIIDGKSTDNSMEIIKSYAEKFKHINFISEKDLGIYNAMNKGIMRASGEIIGIISSNDWYETNSVAHIVNSFQINGNGVYHGFMRVVKNEKEFYIERTSSEFLAEKFLQHPTCFITKAIYERYGTFNEYYKISSDFDLMLRLKRQKVPFIMIDELIANFMEGGVSSTIKGAIETLRIKKEYELISKKKYYSKCFELQFKEVLKRRFK